MLSKAKFFIGFFIVIISCYTYAASQDIYPFNNHAQQKQFQQLTEQLRCLVCQNESLADSNAGLANDLRKEVYNMVIAGDNDVQIKQYLINRYGDFILFKPAINRTTYILWFSPFFILIVAFLMVFIFIKQRKKMNATVTFSAEEESHLRDLLKSDELKP